MFGAIAEISDNKTAKTFMLVSGRKELEEHYSVFSAYCMEARFVGSEAAQDVLEFDASETYPPARGALDLSILAMTD